MAWDDLIPEIWSQRTVSLVRKNSTAAQIVNTAYTGDIAQAGDVVRIAGEGPVAIADYTDGEVGNDVAPATYVPTITAVTVDQAKYYSVRMPNVDTQQAATTWANSVVSRGAYGLADAADTYVYGLHGSAGFNNYESGTTPWHFDTASATNDIPAFFASLMSQAESNNIEVNDLVVVCPPEVREAVNLYFGTRDTGLSDGVIQRGFAGNFFGIQLWISNNLDYALGSPPTTHGLCFPRGQGIALVDSVTETKVAQLEQNFGVNLMGLYLYGAAVYDSTRVIDVNLQRAGDRLLS